MLETNKNDFAIMMRVTWQNYGRNAPDRELMKFWFEKLEAHGLDVVGNAFDKWIDSQADQLPSLKNISDMCKPAPAIYARLPAPVSTADNKRHADEVVKFVADGLTKTHDMRAWARKIIAAPKNYPDISFSWANKALINE
jgi:hypothetical protein